MKRIMLAGTVACGKTTLCQRLNGLEQTYKKTQSLEVVGTTIDTPGEYLEHRAFLRGLVTKADLATDKQLRDAREMLELTGASPIFTISSVTQEGMEELLAFLEQ